MGHRLVADRWAGIPRPAPGTAISSGSDWACSRPWLMVFGQPDVSLDPGSRGALAAGILTVRWGPATLLITRDLDGLDR